VWNVRREKIGSVVLLFKVKFVFLLKYFLQFHLRDYYFYSSVTLKITNFNFKVSIKQPFGGE